jgi:hypothetical protein
MVNDKLGQLSSARANALIVSICPFFLLTLLFAIDRSSCSDLFSLRKVSLAPLQPRAAFLAVRNCQDLCYGRGWCDSDGHIFKKSRFKVFREFCSQLRDVALHLTRLGAKEWVKGASFSAYVKNQDEGCAFRYQTSNPPFVYTLLSVVSFPILSKSWG